MRTLEEVKSNFLINMCKLPVRVCEKGTAMLTDRNRESARGVISNKDGVILISGTQGAGKTTIALAVCEAAWEVNLPMLEKQKAYNDKACEGSETELPLPFKIKPLYVSAEMLIAKIHESFKSDKNYFEKLIKPLKDAQFLIVDEFNYLLESKSEHMEMIMFSLFNERFNSMKPTLCLSNLGIEGIDAIDPRVGSRFRDGKIFPHIEIDHRGKNEEQVDE